MVRNGHRQVGRPADPISLSLIKNLNVLPTAAGHVLHEQTHQTTAGGKFWQKTVSKEQQAINAASNSAATNFDADSDANATGTDSRNPPLPLMEHLGFQSLTKEQIANVDTLRQSVVQQLPGSSTLMSSAGMTGPDGKGTEVLGPGHGLGQDESACVNCPETDEVCCCKIGGVLHGGYNSSVAHIDGQLCKSKAGILFHDIIAVEICDYETLQAATNVESKDCSEILRTMWTPTAMRGEGGGTSPAAFRPFVRCGLRASCSTAAHP